MYDLLFEQIRKVVGARNTRNRSISLLFSFLVTFSLLSGSNWYVFDYLYVCEHVFSIQYASVFYENFTTMRYLVVPTATKSVLAYVPAVYSNFLCVASR